MTSAIEGADAGMDAAREGAERLAHELCQWLEDERDMGSDDSVYAEIAVRAENAIAAYGEAQRAAGEADMRERCAARMDQEARLHEEAIANMERGGFGDEEETTLHRFDLKRFRSLAAAIRSLPTGEEK